MNPEDVLRPLVKRFEIPDTVVRLLYLLLQREIENDYFSLHYSPEYDKDDPALRYARGLLHIFSKLPKIYDLDDSKLVSNIYSLAGLTDLDRDFLYSLCTPISRLNYEKWERHYKDQLHTYQSAVDRRISGQDVNWERSQVRYYKEQLNELTIGEENSCFTQFWLDLVHFNVTFDLPHRMEHCLVCGASGSGKTTLLKQLILADIQTDSTVIVLTPKGDLIPTIAGLAQIPSERILYITPETEFNIFDMEGNRSRVTSLINYIFSYGLDATTTSKQAPLLKNCIEALLDTPSPTLDALYDLLKEPRVPLAILEHIEDETVRDFMRDQFPTPTYKETKDQLKWRLDALRANPLIRRIFSATKTNFNIEELMKQNKIILIDASLRILDEGAVFFGRFFIALIRMAMYNRDKNSNDVYCYIDESQLFLDATADQLFDMAREACIGMTVCTLGLSHLRKVSTHLESAILTNTATKFIGACPEDASIFATHTQTKAELLAHQPQYHFTLYSRGFTRPTVSLTTNPKYIDSLPRRSLIEIDRLATSHREHFAPPRLKLAAEPDAIYTPDPETKTPYDW